MVAENKVCHSFLLYIWRHTDNLFSYIPRKCWSFGCIFDGKVMHNSVCHTEMFTERSRVYYDLTKVMGLCLWMEAGKSENLGSFGSTEVLDQLSYIQFSLSWWQIMSELYKYRKLSTEFSIWIVQSVSLRRGFQTVI